MVVRDAIHDLSVLCIQETHLVVHDAVHDLFVLPPVGDFSMDEAVRGLRDGCDAYDFVDLRIFHGSPHGRDGCWWEYRHSMVCENSKASVLSRCFIDLILLLHVLLWVFLLFLT